jgi:hypothetical protein
LKFPALALLLVLSGDTGRLGGLFFAEANRTIREGLLGNHEFSSVSFQQDLRKRVLFKLFFPPPFNMTTPSKFSYHDSGLHTLVQSCGGSKKDVAKVNVNGFQKIEDCAIDNHNIGHESDISG